MVARAPYIGYYGSQKNVDATTVAKRPSMATMVAERPWMATMVARVHTVVPYYRPGYYGSLDTYGMEIPS